MSKYTTEVRYICEFYADEKASKDYRDYNDYHNEYLSDKYNIDEIIDKAIPRVFESDITLFDPEYKPVLLHKILRHYYMREIGSETVALWKFNINTTLKEILPYYNQLYKSELIKFDPMQDTDMNTTRDGTTNGNIDVSGKGTGKTTNEQSTTGTRNTTGNEHYNEDTTNNTKITGKVTDDGTRNTDGKEGSTGKVIGKTTVADTTTADNTGTSQTDTTGNYDIDRTHLDLYADTPQSGIQGLLGYNSLNGETVNDVKFLTNARRITENEGQTHAEHVTGETTGHTSYTDNSTTDTTNDTTGNRTYEEHEGTKKTQESTSNEDGTGNTTGTRNNSVDETSGGTLSGTVDSNTTNESKTVSKNTEQYIMHIAGKTGGKSYSKMLEEFRETFLNIDLDIINRLEPCFIQLW